MENNFLDNDIPENIRNVFDKSTASAVDEKNKNLTKDKNNLDGSDSVGKVESNMKKGEIVMEKTEIIEMVKAELDTILKEKDAKAKVEEKIVTLETEKASLTTEVETLKAEKAELEGKLSACEAEKQTLSSEKETLSSEKEALASEKEKVVSELEEAKATLAQIEKDKITAARKEELASAGLLISEESVQEKQIAKISSMTDEEFSEYKQELSAVSASAKKAVETSAKPTEETKEKSTASIEDNKVTVPHAGENFAKAFASVQPSQCDKENVSKYASM